MKLGLERKLKERIPEIAEVVQTLPDAPQLNEQAIQTVLDGYDAARRRLRNGHRKMLLPHNNIALS